MAIYLFGSGIFRGPVWSQCLGMFRWQPFRSFSGTAVHHMSAVNHNVVLTSPKEIVHLEYDLSTLPPRPSDEWTRFVCISDTHSATFDVPDGDVLLHSGDLTNTGTVENFKKTMEWLYNLPHKIKMLVSFAFESPFFYLN